MQARYCSNTAEEAFGKALANTPVYDIIMYPALLIMLGSLLSLLAVGMDHGFGNTLGELAENAAQSSFTAAHAQRLLIAAAAFSVVIAHGVFGNPLEQVEPAVLGKLVERVEKISGTASGVLSGSIEERLLAGRPIRYLDLYAMRREVLQRMPRPLNTRELDVAAQREALIAAAGAPQ
jgi:hypothetical protein